MAGSSFGNNFRVTTFGESHGEMIGCVVDGCPAGLSLDPSDIQYHLDKRRPDVSEYASQRQEADQIEIISGVFNGKTTGAPIGLLCKNIDVRSKDYAATENIIRPGHADHTYFKKYVNYDHRGGGRASARETAMRVAAGAIAQKYLLQRAGIQIRGYVAQIGKIKINPQHFAWDEVERNQFWVPDSKIVPELVTLMESLRLAGDSVGAKVTVVASKMPVGLGEPVYDKLDADLAKALMSINAVKAIEIGDGMLVVGQRGSESRDEITLDGFLSNKSGGILAGISTGQDLIASIAIKPPSSIKISAQTITKDGIETSVQVTGRHDVCVGIRAVPIAVAMVALVLVDHFLECYGNQAII